VLLLMLVVMTMTKRRKITIIFVHHQRLANSIRGLGQIAIRKHSGIRFKTMTDKI